MKKVKYWQLLTWPFASFLNLAFMMAMLFMAMGGSNVYAMTAVVVGIVATGSRIFDGITDPIVGFLTERLSTKFGKVRILLFMGWALMSIAAYLLFIKGPNLNPAEQLGLVYFISAYVIYILGYTLGAIATNLGIYALTKDEPKNRMIIYRYQTIYTVIGSALLSAHIYKTLMGKFIIAPRMAGGAPDMGGFLNAVGLFVIILGLIMAIFGSIGVTPHDNKDTFKDNKETKVSMREVFGLLKTSKNLRAFIVAASSDKLALQTASQSIISTVLFGIFLGDAGWMGNMQLIMMVPTIIIIFLASKYATFGGTKASLVRWSWISVIAAAIFWAFLAVAPHATLLSNTFLVVLLVVFNVTFTGAKLSTSVVTGTMLMDVIEYESGKQGKPMPAIISTVYTFVDKIISSFATTIVALAYAFIGFKENLPQLGIDQPTTELFVVTTFIMLGLPIFAWLTSIFAMRFYDID